MPLIEKKCRFTESNTSESSDESSIGLGTDREAVATYSSLYTIQSCRFREIVTHFKRTKGDRWLDQLHVFLLSCKAQCSNVQKEVGGRNFSLGGGVKRRGGGGEIFCRHGVEKDVGGQILSSIIKERGK